LLDLRINFGGIHVTTSNIHITNPDPGISKTALMSFSASTVDPDGVVLAVLGEATCDVSGCSSSDFALSEDSVDTSGPGFLERTWPALSTATIAFAVARNSTMTIRIDLDTALSAAGRFINASSDAVIFLDGLSYDLVSLDPDTSVSPLPEPAMLSLLAAGVGALAYLYRRRG